jgi:hypothetical protein
MHRRSLQRALVHVASPLKKLGILPGNYFDRD